MRVVLSIACIAMVAMVGGSIASTRTVPVKDQRAAAVDEKKVLRDRKQQRAQQAQMKRLAKKVATFRTATWDCQDTLGIKRTRAGASVWSLPKSITYRDWVVEQWQKRASSCLKLQQRRTMEWNWRAFPQWIIDLGVCESGGSGGAAPGHPNWNAEGSSSHGTFYSAFNIGRSRYDGAAHHMGVRGWHEGKGVPSPYEQAMALIGYVRLYGDGFTGRCAGIARSTWN